MVSDPIFFQPNRVWRCYLGGALLDKFVGRGTGVDDYFPEDWLASVTRAINGERSQGPEEGLARTVTPDGKGGEFLAEMLESDPEGLLGAAHVAKYGLNSALLCKYLDSAVRLPIQCHPDHETSRKLYDSSYGKAESWTILDSRPINGEQPYLLMGFKPGVSSEEFARTVREQDIPAMVSLLHKIPAEVGKTYMVPGRLPHAIGPGVFMLEVQEPSDWVVQPETQCAGTQLTERDMYGPLSPAQALEVFDYAGLTLSELNGRIACPPRETKVAPGGVVSEVIGSDKTDAFALWRADVTRELEVELPRAFGVIVVADGAGTMSWPGGNREIHRGNYFFQPAGLKSVTYTANKHKGLSLILCLPPAS